MNDDKDVIILSRPAPPPPEVAEALRRLIDHCWKEAAADFLETSPLEGRAGHIFPAVALIHYWLLDHEQGRGGRAR
jgi:hypothetical protein